MVEAESSIQNTSNSTPTESERTQKREPAGEHEILNWEISPNTSDNPDLLREEATEDQK